MKSGYDFSKNIFDWSFENPDLINTNDIALYLWLVEKNNRCGWSEKFSVTSTECMGACAFRTYPPYKKSFDKLIELGFVLLIKKSKNQHQPNFIALSKNNKATTKALDKASLKQVESNHQSTFDINKQDKLLNKETINISFSEFWNLYDKKVGLEKSKQKWEKLSEAEKIKIMDFIPKYKKFQPEKKYRKNPESFFNNKTWNDELFGLEVEQKDSEKEKQRRFLAAL